MTRMEPVYAFEELLALAQRARPRFSDAQLRDVLWEFLWSGKLDGLIGLNADAFLSMRVQPSDPSAPRMAIRKTPEIPRLTTGNEIAELVVTTLALSSNGSHPSPADEHLYKEMTELDRMSMEATGSDPSSPLVPLAWPYQRAFALVPEHDRKDAPIITHLLAHLKFSERAKQMIVENIGSTAKLAGSAEEACRHWLVQRMREDQTRPSKADVEAEALTMFPGLTRHGFEKAWRLAAAEVPGSSLTRRGPKPRRGTAQATG